MTDLTPPSSGSSSRARTTPRRKWGRIVLVTSACLVGTSAIALFFIRSALLRRIRNEGVEIQTLEWGELTARTANRAIPGGLGRLHAIGIKARWSPTPLHIEIEHLDYHPPENRLNKPIPGEQSRHSPRRITRDPRSRSRSVPGRLREWLDQQDWDIHVKHGPTLPIGPEETVVIQDIHFKRRASVIDLNAQLLLPSKALASMHCTPRGDLSWDSLHLTCEAPKLFDSPFQIDLDRANGRTKMSLVQGEHSAILVRDRKKNTWSLKAKQFPASWWEAGTSLFSMPTLPFLKVQTSAQLDVDLDLGTPKGPRLNRDLTLRQLTMKGLALQQERIGPNLIELPRIQAQGELKVALRRRRSPKGELSLTLGELEMNAKWSFDANDHAIELNVPEQPCMRWLQTIPEAMRTALAGLTLEGQSAGTFKLNYDPKKRATFDENKPDTVPGTLSFDIPLFERCKVTSEPTLLRENPVKLSSYKHTWPNVGTELKPRTMGRKDRTFVSLNAMPLFSKAMTVTEDPKFREHKGFDTDAMKTAFWYNLAQLRVARGASTISQQTARMLWLGTHRNLTRKLQEMVLTWRLEATVDKRRILELYLNLIELGPAVHGGPDASRFYFGRSITALNLKESLFLATLAPAPHRKSVASQGGSISSRWNDNLLRQIERLRIRGWITSEEAQNAVIAPLGLKNRAKQQGK